MQAHSQLTQMVIITQFLFQLCKVSNTKLPRITPSFFVGAIDEAAFMTGLERNSDIVIGASYAPLLNVSCLLEYMQRAKH